MLKGLNARLADRKLSVSLTAHALTYVIEQGFDPVYGARPLKRYIQSHIETLVARNIISAAVHPGDTMLVDVDPAEGLVIRTQPAAPHLE